jgi:tRNA threonylcarbamoyladenosine biosynthesis protein TsaE
MALGKTLGKCLTFPMIIALNGTLGVGKSTLVRALLKSKGITGTIKSPSYSWVESYSCPAGIVYHFDFYRFKDPEEWEAYGFDEYFSDNAVIFIEWANKVLEHLPPIDLSIELDYADSGRHVMAYPHTLVGTACLTTLINALATP